MRATTGSAMRREDRRKAAGPALRTFFEVARRWDLSGEEQMRLLGLTARSTLMAWKRDQDVRLSPDTLERVSCVLGIFKALGVLLPDAAAADRWVREPNGAPLFGGRPALERMLAGHVSDLFVVRQYLAALCGGEG